MRRPTTHHRELPIKITRGKSLDTTVFKLNCSKCMKRLQIQKKQKDKHCVLLMIPSMLSSTQHFKVIFNTDIEKNHNLLEDLAECLCGGLFFSLFSVKALPLAMETRSKSMSSLLTELAWKQWERMYTIMKQNITFSECSSHYSK